MKYESLTKENFWNALMEQFPSEMEQFCKWIDEYKKRVEWINLFRQDDSNIAAPKFHDLPVAMQIGIFFQFTSEIGYGLFHESDLDVPINTDDFVKEIKGWFKAAATFRKQEQAEPHEAAGPEDFGGSDY